MINNLPYLNFLFPWQKKKKKRLKNLRDHNMQSLGYQVGNIYPNAIFEILYKYSLTFFEHPENIQIFS